MKLIARSHTADDRNGKRLRLLNNVQLGGNGVDRVNDIVERAGNDSAVIIRQIKMLNRRDTAVGIDRQYACPHHVQEVYKRQGQLSVP